MKLTRSEILSVSRTPEVVDEVLSGRGKGQVLDAAHEAFTVRHLFPKFHILLD